MEILNPSVDIDIALSTNPEGFTLGWDGDWKLVTPETFPELTGYAVGGVVPSLKLKPNTHNAHFVEICDWIKKYGVQSGQFYGGWKDSDTGLFYVDVVEIIPTLSDALEAARQSQELAVGVFKRGEYVDTIQVS